MNNLITLAGGDRGLGGARHPNRPVSHHGRAPIPKPAAFAVVWHTRKGVRSLRGRNLFRQLRASFQRCCEKKGFRVTNFLVEGGAVHLLVEAADNASLSRGLQGLGVSMAKRINFTAGRRGPAFADRYSVRPIATLAQARRELDFIMLAVECTSCGAVLEWPQRPGPFTSHCLEALADDLTACPQTPILRAVSPSPWDLSSARPGRRSG